MATPAQTLDSRGLLQTARNRTGLSDFGPPDFMDRFEALIQGLKIWPAVLKSLDLNSQHPRTYLRHDVHIGNWYCTGAGRMGLTDWQLNVNLPLSYR